MVINMTVKELIDKLKEFPEDLEVLNYEYWDIYDIEMKEIPFYNCEKFVII